VEYTDAISNHFTYGEFIRSETATRKGIDNTPSPESLEALKFTAEGMDKVRVLLGRPVHVLSGFRSLKLNTAVGGARNSQHMTGEACDFCCPEYGTPAQVCEAVMASDIAYDQIINEMPGSPSGGWCHISFNSTPRRQAFVTHDGKSYKAA
jgi:zinc D-Ala-D-Ala carboxypeptidase